jgi:protein-S-isoprenylcysteine O-methyltransferase Ste14
MARDPSAPTTLRAASAIGVALGSVALANASASRFRRTGTTLEPVHLDRTTALVTSGANSITRNPMYVGLAGLLLANAVRKGSWLALVPLAAFVGVVDRLQITAEESALRVKFGDEYAAYCASVPRWLDRRSLGLNAFH